MKNLKHMWIIALKDLKIFSRDRATVFFFIIFPFMFIVLFTFLMKGVGGEDKRLEIHLATREAAGGLSQQIISSIETKDEALLAPGDPLIIWDKDYDAARQAVEDGKLGGFLAFPADFTPAMTTGSGTNLEIFADASATNTRAVLSGVAAAISSQISTDMVIIGPGGELLGKSGAAPDEIEAAINRTTDELFAGGPAER